MAEDELGNIATAQSGENLLRIEYDYDDPDYWDYVDIYDDEYRRNQFQKSASVDVPTGVLSGAWTMISWPSIFDGETTTSGQILFSDGSVNPTYIEADMEGEYVIQYEVTTNGGNTYSDTFTLIWDQTDPTSTDDAPVGRQNGPITVDIDCDDTSATTWANSSGCERIYYSINEGSWDYLDTDYEDFDIYFDQDGSYIVEYYAVDRAGNSEEDEVNNTFTLQIDQTDPTVSVNMDWMGEGDDENLYSTGQSQNVTITTDDNLSGIATCTWAVENAQYGTTGDVTFDDGEDDGCDFMNVTATQPGIYTIRVTVTDNAGNSDYDEFVLYYDNSVPVVENLNVTVESYDTIHIAWLASNTGGFSPIERVFYYIDYEDAGNGFLILSEEDVATTTFYDDIDIQHLANGTYTLYVRATTQSEITSEWMSQSFTKTSSPGQLYGPTVISSTPSNAATHVSVAAGVAAITFDQNIDFACHYNGECYSVDIKKVSDGTSVVSGGEAGLYWTDNVLSIEYSDLEYNTNYVIHIPASSIDGANWSWNTQETFIYFTTQVGTAPDIEGLRVDYVGATSATIYSYAQPRPDTYEYRISTTAYLGEREDLTANEWPFYANLNDLSPNTTYYYQVRFVNNGHTVVSVPMSFKTAAAEDGIVVHNIARILNNVDPVVGGNYSNGYHFRFYLTINDLYEHRLEFKLANWSRTDGGTMAVANNTRVEVSEEWTNDYDDITTLTNTDYTIVDSNVTDIDADTTLGGRQLYLDLFYKIPTGAQGVYTTSFGIKATNLCPWSEGWLTPLESRQTSC